MAPKAELPPRWALLLIPVEVTDDLQWLQCLYVKPKTVFRATSHPSHYMVLPSCLELRRSPMALRSSLRALMSLSLWPCNTSRADFTVLKDHHFIPEEARFTGLRSCSHLVLTYVLGDQVTRSALRTGSNVCRRPHMKVAT